MRGSDREQGSMFSYVSLEERIPRDHPLRAMRAMVDETLKKLSRRFWSLYADSGRPSIPPERLLLALLLQILYSIRSVRLLMEQLEYNLLFRWFVGLGIDDSVWVATVFTKNRDRLLQGEVAQEFFEAVLAQGRERGLLSSEHFWVDGTLIEAWASQKSFRRKDRPDDGSDDDAGNPTVNFRGEHRSNATQLPDTQSGFRVYPIAAVLEFGTRRDRYAFEGEVLILASLRGIEIVSREVAVYYPPLAERVSHYQPWRDTVRIIFTVVPFLIGLRR